jgi:hypothetical protein
MGLPNNLIATTLTDITNQRLKNHFLIRGQDNSAEVVRCLGAVQSQDFIGAKWALGQRCIYATDAEVTRLYNEGKILRTHMLRPTWHFVAPDDIRWMQELTAPRVHAFNKYYYKKLELNEGLLKKGSDVLAKALAGGKELTRQEVKEVFALAGIEADGLRLGLLVMYAELEAFVCSGALKGKQHTLALLAERAPQARSLPREEALAELTKRFFTSHGPATEQDLVWWSSLTKSEVQKGIDLAGLDCIEIEGINYYYTKATEVNIPSPVVHLLPNYDEYVIAYKNRSLFSRLQLDRTPTYMDLYKHIIILDGQLVGGWKRLISPKVLTIKLNLFKKLDSKQMDALDASAERLQKFLNLPVKIN